MMTVIAIAIFAGFLTISTVFAGDATQNAPRDQNKVPALLGVNRTTGTTVPISAQPNAKALLVTGASCTATTTIATIGPGLSTRILATSTNRAWASIRQPLNATNTPSVAFNQDIKATLAGGISLMSTSGMNTASTTDHIEFGLQTAFPYTGSVTAISNLATTSLQVTECQY